MGLGAGVVWFFLGGNVVLGRFFDGVNKTIEGTPERLADAYDFWAVCSANGGSITAKPRGKTVAVSAQGFFCSLPNTQSLGTVQDMFPDTLVFVESNP